MHKIDSTGATAGNEFTEGNPGTGVPPTVVDADWLNSVQRELVNVIEGSGQTLSDSDDTQLRKAIGASYRRKARPTGGNAPTDFASGTYGMGTPYSRYGEICLPSMKDLGWSWLYSVNVTVAADGAIAIPVLARDDELHLYIDGTLIDSLSSAGSSPETLDWTATAGAHLVQLVHETDGSGDAFLVVGEWIDGTNVQFVSTPA